MDDIKTQQLLMKTEKGANHDSRKYDKIMITVLALESPDSPVGHRKFSEESSQCRHLFKESYKST